MIHISSTHTSISASEGLIRFQASLLVIAVYAKLTCNYEIFSQVKCIYNEVASQFNECNRPKKKGFWEGFIDNLTLNMDTESFTPAKYFDENDPRFSCLYEMEKSKSDSALEANLKAAIYNHNRKYGG